MFIVLGLCKIQCSFVFEVSVIQHIYAALLCPHTYKLSTPFVLQLKLHIMP
uniref:Uncharacterized protein n=1 Tax=Anguilla anguilla TaxID=7936 RepID=A0A0E9TJ90_ANGAN